MPAGTGLSGKFPDPCKSGKTGRIIDSVLRFNPIILDNSQILTRRSLRGRTGGCFRRSGRPNGAIRGLAGEGAKSRFIRFKLACCRCAYYYIDNNGCSHIGAKLRLGKPAIDTRPCSAERGRGAEWPADREHPSAEPSKIPYPNSATMAADALRQSAYAASGLGKAKETTCPRPRTTNASHRCTPASRRANPATPEVGPRRSCPHF